MNMNKDINKEVEYYHYRDPDPMIDYLIRQVMWETYFPSPSEEEYEESEDNPWLEDDLWFDEEDDLW